MIKINLFCVFIILFQINIYRSFGINDTIPINNNIKLDPSTEFYLIKKIKVEGNKRTKRDIIIRELSINEGDKLNKSKTIEIIEEEKRKLLIANESKAGDPNAKSFKPGECSLIYTGGPIYGKNKKIIPKENFIIKDNFIQILSHPKDDFIRYKASDIHKNKIYLRKRSIITLRALALAKSMKINRVKVLQKPKVLVICTGDEIKSDSIIPSTNNIFIKFFVEYFGGKIINIDFARDNEKN